MPWATIISFAIQLIGFGLQRYQASKEMIAAFLKLVDSAKNDGLISQDTQTKFQNLHDELMSQFKEQKP